MLVSGVGCSEAIDKAGERLIIEGLDISSVKEGTVYLNWEHRSGDSGTPLDTVGKVIYAHKIFKASDCENEIQKDLWKELELPFCYIVCRIDDEAGNPSAMALAATIRSELKNEGKVIIGFSVEGSTLDRKDNDLLETNARGWAITTKPANTSSKMILIEDPGAPEGFNKNPGKVDEDPLADAAKAEPGMLSNGMIRFGHQERAYSNPIIEGDLSKAIEAGNYNVAPGSLTGGAALQREDQSLHRAKQKNQLRAALRDWNEKSEPDFKKFLKHKLPDADESFLDRFSDMVNDFKLKKKQARPEDPDLFATMEKKAPIPNAPEPEVDDADDAPDFVSNSHLTIRGKPVKSSTVGRHAKFDEGTGILHTQYGQFPMYIPGRDQDPKAREGFHAAMHDPKVSAIHSYAIKNWRRAHELLKAGKLPDPVIMHAALFSMNSPNTPVAMQELMYGHLVDTMRKKKIDARSPAFKWLRNAWLGSDSPSQYPEHSRQHFLRHDQQLRNAKLSGLTGREAGEIGGFMLGSNKFANMSQYHRLHPQLVELLQHHGHDAQAAVEDMMIHKREHKLWDKRRGKALETGQSDPGEFPGMRVRGLAPKTSRYMMGMLGGGNVTVPDTHFIRHLFGLEKYNDNDSIKYLKQLLWSSGNTHVLNAMDRYYAQHHDAVKHIQGHPDLQGVDQQDMSFPAFWRHWQAIVPHEEARGMNARKVANAEGDTSQELTDHAPFWDAIHEYLTQGEEAQKHDQDAFNVALDAARQHADWRDSLGEVPAQMMFWALLAPKLMGDAGAEMGGPDANGTVDQVTKFECMAVNLQIAVEGLHKAMDEAKADEGPISFRGKKVKPGKIFMHNRHGLPDSEKVYHVLGHDDENFFIVPHGKKNWGPKEVRKLSKLGKDVGYHIERWPQYVGSDQRVDAAVHGDPSKNTHPEQVKLIHGLDVGSKPLHRGRHEQRAGFHAEDSEWRRGPNGVVFLKADGEAKEFPQSHREVAFHNLARDVFGLGGYLPTTAWFKHPVTGQGVAAVQKLKGARHAEWEDSDFRKHMESLHSNGDLDKIALTDYVLGNSDRNPWNIMMSPEGLKLIDHGDAFSDEPVMPSYMDEFNREYGDGQIHPGAMSWIKGISPQVLAQHMQKQGVPQERILDAVSRLGAVHDLVGLDPQFAMRSDLTNLYGKNRDPDPLSRYL